MEVRDELISLYTTYNPKRLKDVDALLERFKGREHVILRSLRERYAKGGTASSVVSTRASSEVAADSDVLLGEASSQCVPALKPVTPTEPPTDHLRRVSSSLGRADTAAPSTPSGGASPLSPSTAPPLSTPPPSAFVRDIATPTVATRRAEMQDLILQMTSLDVGVLAARVAALTRSPPPSSAASCVPRLQLGQPGTADPAAVHGDVAAVLHHTAVFVTFFATCARRYLELAAEVEAEAAAAARRGAGVATSAGVGATPMSPTRDAAAGVLDVAPPSPPSPPSPPPKRIGVRAASSCVRGIRASSGGGGGSPWSTDGAGSPPVCRTATNSPLSSPDGRTPNGQRLLRRVASLSPPPPPSPPPTQSLAGPLTIAATDWPHHPSRVLTWAAAAGQASRYGAVCKSLRSGDCVVLQPGVYYETLHFEGCGSVELTSAYPGAAVVLRPASDLEPVITVAGPGTRITLTGVVLVQGDMAAAADGAGGGAAPAGPQSLPLGIPTVPLLSVRDSAEVRATASHFYGGAGGGVVAAGLDTRLRLDLCLVSLCGFAGVYVHGGATADITQSKIKRSEVGLRVMRGSFVATETTLEGNTSDGVVLYEESMGVLERSNVFDNAGNGVFLASGAELRVVASTIELNALYGVQRARGSALHVKASFVRDNGLLPINEVVG